LASLPVKDDADRRALASTDARERDCNVTQVEQGEETHMSFMKGFEVWTGLAAAMAVALSGGCASPPPSSETVYVCYQRSERQNQEFAYPCADRQRARAASMTCDLMAASAYDMVQTNRRIGPTTPKELLITAGVEGMSALTAMRQQLGEDVFEAYVQYMASMSIEIADRNITDLIAYPKQQFTNCLREFNYSVREG
jgi:hypothetical protein